MITKFVPIQVLIQRIITDLGLDYDTIPWESMVDWIAHGLQHIGAYNQYAQKTCHLEIVNNRAKLPADFYRVDADKFHEPHKLQLDTIIVGFETGPMCLEYLALAVDDDGYPLIPEDVTYQDALFWKVAMQMAMLDELRNKQLTFQYCKQQWEWYCRSARAEAYMGDIQSMQARYNDFTKLKFDTNPLRNQFRDLGKQQILRRTGSHGK